MRELPNLFCNHKKADMLGPDLSKAAQTLMLRRWCVEADGLSGHMLYRRQLNAVGATHVVAAQDYFLLL